MIETNNTDAQSRATATAACELLLLDQQTVKARAALAVLQKELSDINVQLVDSRQIDQLVEANQQLVLANLLAQSDAEHAHRSEEEHKQFLEMQEANAQLVIAALSAQNLQASAEHTLTQQRNILTQVAHELRNPLTPISMVASLLVRVPSEELPRMQALIESQVVHMSRLVDDMLDVSRASTGKLRLNCRTVDMLQIIQEAIDLCQPVMSTRDLHFSAELPNSPMAIDGDPVRLTQILSNLLGNAAKYTQAGGIITLSVTTRDDMLEIKVCDNGIGISAQVLPLIFDPFVQDAHAVGAGLGIGLTLVRELVEAHGGTVVGLSDGDGQGSMFVVTLPLAATALS
jgi:signal transduction histidine kinase